METILLDLATADDRTLVAWHDLHQLLQREEAPGDEPMGLEQLLLDVTNQPPDIDETRWIVLDDRGVVMAWASVGVRDAEDNRHLAFVRGGTHPEARRRGLGTDLLRRCAQVAAGAARTKLALWAIEGSAGDRFLEASGGTYVYLARFSRCLVTDLDRLQLKRWAQPQPGYTVLTWDAPTPEHHLEGYADVLHVMNTAPLQDADREDEVFTADRVRGRERSLAERKGTKWVAVARHDASGRLAGLSELYLDGFRPERVNQGNTGVEAAHRGQRLGKLLKATNALRLLDEHPQARFITTVNQDGNAPMLAINDAMGFRPHLRYRVHELPVAVVLQR